MRIPYIGIRRDYDTGIEHEVHREAYVRRGGVLPKVRRTKNHVWHWLRGEPAWFRHMTSIVPKRRAGRLWEQKIVHVAYDDLDDVMSPDVGDKPQQYWW
jgi:hypothetical protein